MNIIHVTTLTNNKASGISSIVPHHIKWQAQYANVFWFNLNTDYNPSKEFQEIYSSINNYPECEIRSLPSPFNSPDLVVFHGVYFYQYTKLAKQLNKIRVPYIVVPHGSLTESAIKQKRIKKQLAFFFLFGKFLKEARSIQYLTKGEHEASGDSWNAECIVIPNGCEIPLIQKEDFLLGGLSGVFIGRKSIYYKGLDNLIEACHIVKDELKRKNCKIHIYGPEEEGSNTLLHQMIKKYGLDEIIFIHDAVFHEEKVRVLMNNDFFILPSRSEGHPVALVEALSFGIPSLVTTGTNMADEIFSYNAGWTAEQSSDSIAKALVNVLRCTDNLSTIGENAYKLALEYEWSNIAKISIQKYKVISKS